MMNKKLAKISRDYNNAPKAPFLGLSPSQMRIILDGRFSFDNSLFFIDLEISEKYLEIPIFRQAIFFLNRLANVEEMKCTQKGNLPKTFVIELYEEFFTNDRVCKEAQ